MTMVNSLNDSEDVRTPDEIHRQVNDYLNQNEQFMQELGLPEEALSDEYFAAVAEGVEISRGSVTPEVWDAFLDAVTLLGPLSPAQRRHFSTPLGGKAELSTEIVNADIASLMAAQGPSRPTETPAPDPVIESRAFGNGRSATQPVDMNTI